MNQEEVVVTKAKAPRGEPLRVELKDYHIESPVPTDTQSILILYQGRPIALMLYGSAAYGGTAMRPGQTERWGGVFFDSNETVDFQDLEAMQLCIANTKEEVCDEHGEYRIIPEIVLSPAPERTQ